MPSVVYTPIGLRWCDTLRWDCDKSSKVVDLWWASDSVKVTAQIYIDFLKAYMVPWFKNMPNTFRKVMGFMHKNGSIIFDKENWLQNPLLNEVICLLSWFSIFLNSDINTNQPKLENPMKKKIVAPTVIKHAFFFSIRETFYFYVPLSIWPQRPAWQSKVWITYLSKNISHWNFQIYIY